MPAVEIGALPAPVAPGKAPEAALGNAPNRPATDKDFASVMQATLAPVPQKLPDKHASRPESSSRATGIFFPAVAPTPAVNPKAPAAGAASEKPGKSPGPEKKAAHVSGEKIPVDLRPAETVPDTAEPLPAFWPLPLFLSSAGDLPQAGKLDAAPDVSPVAGQATGKIAATHLSPAAPPVALNPVTPDVAKALAKPAGETVENLPPNGFVPVAKADAETLKAVVADPQTPPLVQPGTHAHETRGTNPAAPENFAPSTNADKIFSPADLPAAPVSAGVANQISPSLPAAPIAGNKTEPPPAVALEPAAENAGTGVATTELQMKNPKKTNKVAGLAVKVLPVGQNDEAHEKNLPTQWRVAITHAADNRGADLNFAFANGNNQAAENAPGLNAVDLPSLAETRLRAVDRTHDMIALHAMRLVESKSDALSVVIKPAVGTELSLELRQRGGGVEAQATLTRGDHQFLSLHWPDLQQRLEQRGIKLAPLGGAANFSANDNGHFQRQQHAAPEAAAQQAAFAEFAATGGAGGATARLAATHDGWESWA